MTQTFLTAEWRKLIMVQYAIDPEKLMPYLPAGVDLDLYGGKCFVSLVAFLFEKVRVKGLAIPFHTRFEEVNLRFYVKREAEDGGLRRGVVFVREFVPRRAIAMVAARFYEEPYQAIPTRHSITQSEEGMEMGYGWRMGDRWHSVAVAAEAAGTDIAPGSVEEFITEHYRGYTKRSDNSTSEYEVQHPRWKTYRVKSYELAVDMGMLYGAHFAFLTDQRVENILLAEGSAVRVLGGRRLAASTPDATRLP